MLFVGIVATCADYSEGFIADQLKQLLPALDGISHDVSIVVSCTCNKRRCNRPEPDRVNVIWYGHRLSLSQARNILIAHFLETPHCQFIWFLEARTILETRSPLILKEGSPVSLPFTYGQNARMARVKVKDPLVDCTISRYIFERKSFEYDKARFSEGCGIGSASIFQAGEDTLFLAKYFPFSGEKTFVPSNSIFVKRLRNTGEYRDKRLKYAEGHLLGIISCFYFGNFKSGFIGMLKYIFGFISKERLDWELLRKRLKCLFLVRECVFVIRNEKRR